jgi:hypothetical protein
MRWTPTGWGTLVRTTGGGCDAVLKAAPTFPRNLCSAAKRTEGATVPW